MRRIAAGGALVTFAAVAGPGVIAGLSDDDPAGITTYSILGADYGYELLWVLTLSTLALVAFHELGARMGLETGKGLMLLIRERFGAALRGHRSWHSWLPTWEQPARSWPASLRASSFLAFRVGCRFLSPPRASRSS